MDLLVWLIEGQQVHDVAVSVDLLGLTTRCNQRPGEHSLSRFGARRQTQALDAVLDRSVVAIQGVVTDMQ
jgi:hypothetical protein